MGRAPCLSGMTLRQRLVRDKTLVKNKECQIHFGKNYYARLRSLYAEDSGLEGMLALGGELPEARLFSAFKNLIRHPPLRTDMVLWCERAQELTPVSTKLLCQALRRLSHSGCKDQLETAPRNHELSSSPQTAAAGGLVSRHEASVRHLSDTGGLSRVVGTDLA